MPSHPVADRILVIGAGLAGLRTVAELRAAGFTGHIRLIGGEIHPPYDRPPLSKELLSHPAPVWLSEDLGHDLEMADEVHLGVRAEELHLGAGPEVRMADGATYAADHVVLATGSVAIRPPSWQGAVALHTLDEAEYLRAQLQQEGPGLHLVVIGAGWIGAEVAGVAAEAGSQVDVLEAGPTPLWRQLGPELGGRTSPWYAEAGVKLHTDTAVTAVEDHTVHTGEDQLHADIVLCAVGARPDTAWLGDAVPRTQRGHVVVDAAGRSSVPGVWAVGDVAEREHPVFGRTPGGHWSAALTDPVALARAMMGLEPPEVEPAPYLNSMQLGHQLAVYGRLTEDRLTRGDAQAGPWTTLCFEADRLTGAVIADAPREVSGVRKLLGRGELPVLDRELAADPTVKLAKTRR
ncbi:MAG TPA: FAD-dependent oxidoreductase [Ruania sp.]|nr:FAD-dependent oxidoreductase [Ruania sp.]